MTAMVLKLHTAPRPAPNPRRVHIYLAETGIDDIAFVPVDMRARAHKDEAFLKLNPMGQLPTLELEDGTGLGESVAICRYLEDTRDGGPKLFGNTPLERARIEEWNRRVETTLNRALGMFWIHGHPFTAKLVKQNKEMGEASRREALRWMAWFDDHLGDREFLAGPYSVADISAQCFLDFGTDLLDLPIPDECTRLRAWHARLDARPSARAFA